MSIMSRFSIKQRVMILSVAAIGFYLVNILITFMITEQANEYEQRKDILSTSIEAFLDGMVIERDLHAAGKKPDIQPILTYWDAAKQVLAPLEEEGQNIADLIEKSQEVLQKTFEKRHEMYQTSESLDALYLTWRQEARQVIAKVEELIGVTMMQGDVPEATLADIKHTSSTLLGLWSEAFLLLNDRLLLKKDDTGWQEAYSIVLKDIQKHQQNLRSLVTVTEDFDFNPAMNAFETFSNKSVQAIERIHILWQENQELAQKIDDLKTLTLQTVKAKEREYQANVQATQNRAKQLGVGISVTMIIILGLLSLSITLSITHKLRNILKHVEYLASLDLMRDFEIPRARTELDILAGHLNTMVREFRSVVGQVQRSGIQVTSSSTELAAMAKEQEAIAASQVEATNQVVHSVESISMIASNLVETMQRVASMLQETIGFATSGQSDLLRMEEAMRHMEDASKSISDKLETINEKADNITNVVTTINKVSEQTNLLSLNAAIEAEKAGEVGRGFAVVAREIRRLADQTAVATLDIERMVREMQSAVASGVMEMDKFIQEVQHSAEDVGKISMQLTLIIDQVQALSPNFEAVNASMVNQSASAQEITSAMLRLSDEMKQTRESLHETYAAIGQLNEAAQGLQHEVSRFKVT